MRESVAIVIVLYKAEMSVYHERVGSPPHGLGSSTAGSQS